MVQEYEVSAERLWEDLRDLVSRLADNELVEVINEDDAVA
jgi:glutamate 5-kinase